MKATTFKDIDYLACFTTNDKSKTGFEADERSFIPIFSLKCNIFSIEQERIIRNSVRNALKNGTI